MWYGLHLRRIHDHDHPHHSFFAAGSRETESNRPHNLGVQVREPWLPVYGLVYEPTHNPPRPHVVLLPLSHCANLRSSFYLRFISQTTPTFTRLCCRSRSDVTRSSISCILVVRRRCGRL